MKYSKKKFDSTEEAKNFVTETEREFEAYLDRSIEKICSIPDIKTVALSGPTCSGKTTTAKKLIEDFSKHGRNVHVISIDDFFCDVHISDIGDESPDFDSIDALDLDMFISCTQDIFADRATKIPRFDFITGKRSGFYEFDPDPDGIYIFEGIQAIYPEITAVLSGERSRSICICPRSSLNVGGTVFEPNEIRLMRRIVRDRNFRGASPEYTMFLWENVRKNEDKNIFPHMGTEDVSIDSTIPYEINILTQFLRPMLDTIKEDSKYYREAERLMKKTEGIQSIPSIFVPNGAMYYEFIKNEHIN